MRDQLDAAAAASEADTVLARRLLGGLGAAKTSEGQAVVRRFLADERQSKPLGFYTWSEELSRVFRQDRLLQAYLGDAEDAPQLAATLGSMPGLLAAYDQCLLLAEQCTNQLVGADFGPWANAIATGDSARPVEPDGELQALLALFPASRSHETDLARRLYGPQPIPKDADLLGELIRAVRSGEVDLRPGRGSGWHDWQMWALETLLSPNRAEEAGRVLPEQSYRDHLEGLFRAAMALGRETHVKQLDCPRLGVSMRGTVVLRPDLRLEPLVTQDARRAEGYRFIRGVLHEPFGEPALDSLHRQRCDGLVEAPLAAELDAMIALFDGATNVARLELGAPAEGETQAFVRWTETREEDPDITSDLRMMVPVYHDIGRNLTKVWMFLGWMEDSIDVSFERPPEVTILSGRDVDLEFEESSYPIAAPVVVEALVARVLDRDEFRALCDRCASPEAILSAVQ